MGASSKEYVLAHEYFDELFLEFQQKYSTTSSEFTRKYIIELLVFFISIDNLYKDDKLTGKKKAPLLSEEVLKSYHQNSLYKTESLKRIADFSLYTTGMFSDYFKKKIIDVDYYISLGKNSYNEVSKMVEDTNLINIYLELSEKFVQFVDILNYISEKSSMQNNEDILRNCERYLLTKSDKSLGELEKKNIIISAQDIKNTKH